jgi:hypothetical protein
MSGSPLKARVRRVHAIDTSLERILGVSVIRTHIPIDSEQACHRSISVNMDRFEFAPERTLGGGVSLLLLLPGLAVPRGGGGGAGRGQAGGGGGGGPGG